MNFSKLSIKLESKLHSTLNQQRKINHNNTTTTINQLSTLLNFLDYFLSTLQAFYFQRSTRSYTVSRITYRITHHIQHFHKLFEDLHKTNPSEQSHIVSSSILLFLPIKVSIVVSLTPTKKQPIQLNPTLLCLAETRTQIQRWLRT